MLDPKFTLGRVLVTPAAMLALTESGQGPDDFISRHVMGDWGDLSEGDKAANDDALAAADQILSAYTTLRGVRVWIVTEGDRSATTCLLPSEY